jgi:hypothetical protein
MMLLDVPDAPQRHALGVHALEDLLVCADLRKPLPSHPSPCSWVSAELDLEAILVDVGPELLDLPGATDPHGCEMCENGTVQERQTDSAEQTYYIPGVPVSLIDFASRVWPQSLNPS